MTKDRCFCFRIVRTDPIAVTVCGSAVWGMARIAAMLGLDERRADKFRSCTMVDKFVAACLGRDESGGRRKERHIMTVRTIKLRV